MEANVLPFGTKLVNSTTGQLVQLQDKDKPIRTLIASHLHLQPKGLVFSWDDISCEHGYK